MHRPRRELVAEGGFRPDLFYRLSVVRVVLPPLRERREDLAPIVREMLRLRGMDQPGAIEGNNLDRLIVHDWPGNVRELRNAIDRALALSPGATTFAALRLGVEATATSDAPAIRTDLPFAEAKQQVVDAFERAYLRDVLDRCDGNISAAAREAGIDRKHLRTLLVRHGIVPE
jgi:DNA-binding NtrC family response regulator